MKSVKKSKKPLVLLRSKKLIENEIKALDQEFTEFVKKSKGVKNLFSADLKKIKARKTFLLNVIEYYERFEYGEGFMIKSLTAAYAVLKFELSAIEEGERYLLSLYDDFTAKKMVKDMKAAYRLKDKREQIKVIEFIDEGKTIRKAQFKKAEKIEVVQISI